MFVFSRPCHRIGLGQSRKHSQSPVHNAARGLYALAHHTEAETATQGVLGPAAHVIVTRAPRLNRVSVN